jgi:hypothetical protein
VIVAEPELTAFTTPFWSTDAFETFELDQEMSGPVTMLLFASNSVAVA